MRRLSGRYRSSLIIGLQGIRARKVRTLLSMVSLFLGVLAVVVVQAGEEIARKALLSNVELNSGKDGTRVLYLPPSPTTSRITLDTLAGAPDAVGVLSAHAIIGEPGVSPINPGANGFDQPAGSGPGGSPPDASYLLCDASGACTIKRPDAGGVPPPGQAIEVALVGLTGDVRQFRPYRPVSGRWLDFSSPPSLAPRLVLNKEAAKGFTKYRVPAEMRLDGAPANPTPQIIGVVDDGQGQPTVYVRMDELLNWVPVSALGTGAYGQGVQVMLAPTATETEQILRSRLVAGGVNPDDLHVETINTATETAQLLALTRWVFLGMAGLVLLIGVAGILNVGLATVGERVEEFALRRAVGTPRVLLAGIVLVETLLTGLLTAAAAIGVAALVLRLAGGYLSAREPALHNLQFPWQAGVAGIIAGLVAGLLGGLIPALRAARIPIATIMRA